MDQNQLSAWVASVILLSIRIGPVFVFAPPFTLTRVPRIVLALFAMGLAATLVASRPDVIVTASNGGDLLLLGVREAILGGLPVLTLNLMFGALYWIGRTIDIQAGFGLALLIDPGTRNQTPLIGTLFAYLAGAIFFAVGGHHELLRYFAASLDVVPLGGALDMAVTAEGIARYAALQFTTAIGVGGAVVLTLMIADMGVATLSRTVPQLNALLLGVQVKTLLMLLVLAASLPVAQTLMLRMISANFTALAALGS